MSAAKKKLAAVPKIPGSGNLRSPSFPAETVTFVQSHSADLRHDLEEARGYLLEMVFDQLNVIERGKIEGTFISILHCLHEVEKTAYAIDGAAGDLDAHLRTMKKAVRQ